MRELDSLALSNILPVLPKPVQKEIIFTMLKNAGVVLSKNSCEFMEHQFFEVPNCCSLRFLKSWLINSDHWSKLIFDEKIAELKQVISDIENGVHRFES